MRPKKHPRMQGDLQQPSLTTGCILQRINDLDRAAEALANLGRPLAKLAERGLKNWGRNSRLPDWPCDGLRGLVRASVEAQRVSLPDVQRFFKDMAIVDHLQEGRDMRAEIACHFQGRIPFGFVVLAVDAGRVGVLRPFGIRPGRNEITPEDLEYASRLLAIAQEARRELVDALASRRIAWPCPYCCGLMTNVTQDYCSKKCANRDERRLRHLRSAEQRERRKRGE